MVDYFFSRFEFKRVDFEKTTGLIIDFCKEHLSRYSMPNVVVFDSGTQLTSKFLKEFSKEWKFEVVTSLAYNRQSNGEIEAYVKVAKETNKIKVN